MNFSAKLEELESKALTFVLNYMDGKKSVDFVTEQQIEENSFDETLLVNATDESSCIVGLFNEESVVYTLCYEFETNETYSTQLDAFNALEIIALATQLYNL